MNAGHGQCSYTPRPIMLELNVWKQYKFTAEAQFGANRSLTRSACPPLPVLADHRCCAAVPDTSGYLGAAGMVSIELMEQGVAWVDDLRFARVL